MRATGIFRAVDELGRVVLPVELRKTMDINDKDKLEVYVDGDNKIVLKKYETACTFTGATDDLIDYKGKKVSKQAIQELAKLAGL
jgi:transcriptional pleiotropic regulator of transition state genes